MAIRDTLILASASKARQEMMRNAGLAFEIQPADLDERAVLEGVQTGDIQSLAGVLAEAKATAVAQVNPNALVIGCDQTLDQQQQLMMKAPDVESARKKLNYLRGKEHRLISSVCVMRGAQVLWSATDQAFLTMHDFDDDFLDSYVRKAGDALTQTVGAYELEGLGSWLFSKVKGDYFTILGMPLLPLLAYLKTEQGYQL